MKVRCPQCKNKDERVLFRPHWSKKHYEFICGHCKLEFPLEYNKNLTANETVKAIYNFSLKDDIDKMKERLGKMGREELVKRYKELCKE